MVHGICTRHRLYTIEKAYKPDRFAHRQSNPESDRLERDLEAGWNIIPEIAGNSTAGTIRAQVLPSVTWINDADGAHHTGIQAGNGIVKDHEVDTKGSAHSSRGVDCARGNPLLREKISCMHGKAFANIKQPAICQPDDVQSCKLHNIRYNLLCCLHLTSSVLMTDRVCRPMLQVCNDSTYSWQASDTLRAALWVLLTGHFRA